MLRNGVAAVPEMGSLRYPYGVAVDTAGNVYVADWLNNRIQKFNKDGGPHDSVALHPVSPRP